MGAGCRARPSGKGDDGGQGRALGLSPRLARAARGSGRGREHRGEAPPRVGLPGPRASRQVHRYRRTRMSILVNRDTRVLCQGITGSAGSFHSKQMLAYGTNLVAGVTPGKGGEKVEDRV